MITIKLYKLSKICPQIESGPLEEQQIAFIVAEVVKGLDYLHSLGIWHGDVVSHRVMLTQSGEIKLHPAANMLDETQLPRTTTRKDGGCKVSTLHVTALKG